MSYSHSFSIQLSHSDQDFFCRYPIHKGKNNGNATRTYEGNRQNTRIEKGIFKSYPNTMKETENLCFSKEARNEPLITRSTPKTKNTIIM